MSKFYTFRQNNSGGRFNYYPNIGISVTVVVEADDAEEAIYRAEGIGLYFNGCETGRDCYCCGDRWTTLWSDEGYDVPSHYKDDPLLPVFETGRGHVTWVDGPQAFVHYKDGTVVPMEVLK